jgi:hypothetical protein
MISHLGPSRDRLKAKHFTGSAINQGTGTTSFYGQHGQFQGSAGSSIDRAFNFNRR